MKNIFLMSRLTFREAVSRKIFIAFFGISSFVLLIFIILSLSFNVSDFVSAFNTQGDQFNPDREIAEILKLLIITPLFGGGLFLSIFSAASFIPNMLEKGSIDLLLSKPISRYQIIMGKFIGGCSIVLLNIAYLVIGIWVIIGLKFNIWDARFLLTILTITFTFAVLYSLIILIGIVSRSSVLAMMISYIIFFVLAPVLNIRDKITLLADSKLLERVLDGFYYIIPKTSELGTLTGELSRGGGISDWQPIISSLLFMILILAYSIIIFSKKDY